MKSFMMRNVGSRLSVAESIIRADGAMMKLKNMPLIVTRRNVPAALRAVRKSSRLAGTARHVEPSSRRTFAPFTGFFDNGSGKEFCHCDKCGICRVCKGGWH
jgi:hypothetical protein